MVGTDGKPEGYISGLDNVLNQTKEELFKTLGTIFLIGIIIGMLLSWLIITIKKWNREEREDFKKTRNDNNLLIKEYIEQIVKKEVQKVEPNEEAIADFIKEEIKNQLNNTSESD